MTRLVDAALCSEWLEAARGSAAQLQRRLREAGGGEEAAAAELQRARRAVRAVRIGFGRIVASYYRSATLHQIH